MVRPAARSAQLAYAFLRGIPYKSVERKRKPEKEWDFQYTTMKEIKRLVKKFSTVEGEKIDYSEEVERWINE